MNVDSVCTYQIGNNVVVTFHMPTNCDDLLLETQIYSLCVQKSVNICGYKRYHINPKQR